MSSLLQTLDARGCIHDASNREELDTLLDGPANGGPPISFYCGFDPTADSLHAGSMLPLLLMRRLQEKGHKPIVLLGSATGMIGDPSGKSEERVLLTNEQLELNAQGIESQIKLFLSSEGENAYQIVRNDQWLGKLNYINFLRDVGKHFTINSMMAKDSVRSRLENREQGISYTEFSYMLLQAYDFLWLYRNQNCRLQVGGSDQWGNITAGLELIRRSEAQADSAAFGLTFPLLTTSSGAKFGKTEKGAVWLSAERTSPYHFYQYWLNTSDEDVITYLKLFTELDDATLAELEKKQSEAPGERDAQKTLARALCNLVHGKAQSEQAIQASAILFGASMNSIPSETLLDIFREVPSVSIDENLFASGMALPDLLVSAKVCSSKGAARRLIEGGGLYLNNERRSDAKESITNTDFIEEKVLVIRSGKKNYFLVQLQTS